MTVIYSQLRVSCGLSAIINALQPEELKITPNQTFAHWLNVQWLKLTNNNDASNPLVNYCPAKEHQWVAVLDYILLRKIASSFILCERISPAVLTTEADYDDLNWSTLTKVFTIIIDRLNERKEDWPLWNYEGNLKDPKENMETDRYKRRSLDLVQQIKVFYEIMQSNIQIGLEADWKAVISSLGGQFPQKVTPNAIINHLGEYKTDFELSGLLSTLGYVADYTYGMQYPAQVKPNSIVLINRPGHWVCENNSTMAGRGTILDSLTLGTDTVRMGDTFNYFRPLKQQKVFKKMLIKLSNIFPDVEVDIEEEMSLSEFPPLTLPVTDKPEVMALDHHKNAEDAYNGRNFKEALLQKRIECALLEKTENTHDYFSNLVEFTEWCLSHDKNQTAEENTEKLKKIEDKLGAESIEEIIKFHKLLARIHNMREEYEEAASEYALAIEIYENDTFEEPCNEINYELANGLGVSYSRLKDYNKAKEAFKRAKTFALSALEKSGMETAENELGPGLKYWPALVRALDNKINEVSNLHEEPGVSDKVTKVE
ncbi:MAG: hypothetical protein GF364_05225 [Candidatus Lokiarchaeota archaeon]|nr:hypothetical protein [Candidatus Lokiarchaeota archaeon]